MTRVACIDAGTVTCRLAVADVVAGQVRRLAKQSTICNLGEGLTETGRISQAAEDRLLTCVAAYVEAARQAGAAVSCCTLTSAARDASNSAQLLGRLHELGLEPQVIPGEVEGTLTFLGVSQDFRGERILVADSGGGSTELALGTLPKDQTAPRIEAVRSINVGARRVTERFLSAGDPPSTADLRRARDFAAKLFAKAVAEEGLDNRPAERLIVTGGTATSLVAIDARLEPYDSSRVHLQSLTRARVEGLCNRLAALTTAERAELPGLQAKRAPVILGGALTIAELMAQTKAPAMTVSERDLLFGLATVAAAAAEKGASPMDWTPRLAPLS